MKKPLTKRYIFQRKLDNKPIEVYQTGDDKGRRLQYEKDLDLLFDCGILSSAERSIGGMIVHHAIHLLHPALQSTGYIGWNRTIIRRDAWIPPWIGDDGKIIHKHNHTDLFPRG